MAASRTRYAICSSPQGHHYLAALYDGKPIFTCFREDAGAFSSLRYADTAASVLRAAGYNPSIVEVFE